MKKILVLAILAILAGCGFGRTGSTGPQGPAGFNGHSPVFYSLPADTSLCNDGGTVFAAGSDLNDDGVLQVAETTAMAVLCNGRSVPANPYDTVAVVAVCGGDIHDVNNEILFKTRIGLYIGSVSQDVTGTNTHFGVIQAGSYHSTGSNGHECNFTIHTDGTITHD